jgi:hypothetical protein
MLLTVFARLVLRLLLLSALLCAALPALGGRPLPPDEAWDSLGFTVCALPCYAGVVPGKIAYRAAPDELLRQLPLIGRRMFFNNAILNFWASSDHYDLAGWAGSDRGTVGELRLTLPLRIDRLLDQLGTPDCVMTRIRPTERTGIYWVREDISIVALLSLNEHNFNVNSRVTGLWLRAFRADDCGDVAAVRWHGFTSTAEYLP